jgi:uncharacterized protein YebE (UPF0316 family)
MNHALEHLGEFIAIFGLGVILGVFFDRLVVTKWFDELSKAKLRLFTQTVVNVAVVLVFVMLNVKLMLDSTFEVDREIYWIFGLVIGAINGVKLSEDTLSFYIKKLQKNG